MKKWFLYCIDPIDFWEGWTTLEDFIKTKRDWFEGSPCRRASANMDRLFEGFYLAAKHGGWEGDVSNGPFVSGIPSGDSGNSSFMWAWKQSNNGTTYIYSPINLEWLNRNLVEIGRTS